MVYSAVGVIGSVWSIRVSCGSVLFISRFCCLFGVFFRFFLGIILFWEGFCGFWDEKVKGDFLVKFSFISFVGVFYFFV